MNIRPDIVVRDGSGRAVLGVEVKARRGVDAGWAAQLRRNLLAHGAEFGATFFMIVTSTDAYLWRDEGGGEPMARPPDAEARLRELVGSDSVSGSLDGRTLELIVQSWLSAAASAAEPSDLSKSARDFLVGTGLFEILRGAAVEFEPA